MTVAASLRANAARWTGGGSFDPEAELARAAALGVRVLTPGAPGYPPLLAEIDDPPRALYLRGRLDHGLRAVAVVGSRRATPYGLRTARRLAAGLARAGVVVVSGLARGIDAAAHRAALDAGGITWAVLGSGVDRVYPPEHAELAEQIAASGGAVLSELPLGGPPAARHFPMRNRVVAGLSWATVVVEGDLRSGALITARAALAQGRELLAVPGPVDSPLSEGPHALLRAGAAPLCALADLLELLPGRPSAPPDEAPAAPALRDPDEAKILGCVSSDTLSLEELASGTGLGLPRLAGLLARLEQRGLLLSLPGQRYARP